MRFTDSASDTIVPGRAGGTRGSIGFAACVAAGMLALAAAVILPEYTALTRLRADRDALAYQVRCEEKLASYNGRLIDATENDPVLLARLMIRHGNYRPTGCQVLESESSSAAPSVPERLLEEARNPPARRDGWLDRAGAIMADSRINACVVLLALAMLAVGMLLPILRPRTDAPGA